MGSWINERQKRMQHERAMEAGANTSIQEKMHRLQKHQAFEAELTANAQRVQHIADTAKQILARRGLPEAERVAVKKQCDDIQSQWTSLQRAVDEQSRALGEARDLLHFEQMCERVQNWLRDMELMTNNGDMGGDYEHCEMLIKKVDVAQVEWISMLIYRVNLFAGYGRRRSNGAESE